MRTIPLLNLLLVVSGCATSSDNPKKISEQRQLVRDQLSGEVSLKEDRHKLDDLRNEVPADKREENDELAFSLNQTADLREEPSKIRERFQQTIERRRHHFNDKVDKIKKAYQKDETARRDEFLKQQNDKRDKFKSRKHAQDETREFFAQLDRDRLDFHSKENERRSDFNDELREQIKDFNDHMKAKYDEFSEQMRIYTRRFDEAKKAREKPSADFGSTSGGDKYQKLPEPPYDN